MKLLGKRTAPAIIRTVDDSKMRLLALIENVQREDLGILEKSQSILALQAELGSIEKVAESIHKSRSLAFMYARIGSCPGHPGRHYFRNHLAIKEADLLAGLMKDVEKLGNEKTEYIVKRAVIQKPVDRKLIMDLKERYTGKSGDSASPAKSHPRGESKLFWKSKKDFGIQFRFPASSVHDHQVRQMVVKEVKKLLDVMGARKIDIHF